MGNNYGIINEQGFVTQNANLGFKPLTEAERKSLEKALEKDKNKENK